MRVDNLGDQYVELDLNTQRAEIHRCTGNLKVKAGNVHEATHCIERKRGKWGERRSILVYLHNSGKSYMW